MSQGLLPGIEVEAEPDSDSCFTPLFIVQGAEAAMGGIDTDPCWHPDSHVRPRVHGYAGGDLGDGLTLPYVGNLWMNWPFSDPLPWTVRYKEHAHFGNKCLGLGKIDPTTEWWRTVRSARSGRFPTLVGLFRDRIGFEGPYAKGAKPNMVCACFSAGILPSKLRREMPFCEWLEVAV